MRRSDTKAKCGSLCWNEKEISDVVNDKKYYNMTRICHIKFVIVIPQTKGNLKIRGSFFL